MLIDYLWPLCLIVGLGGLKEKKGGKKERAKLRMLNIEVVAGGLMKLTMQVNSLLPVRAPHPPPPPRSVPLSHWLIVRTESFRAVCVAWIPCMEGFRGGGPRSETPVLAPSSSQQTLLRNSISIVLHQLYSNIAHNPLLTSGQTAHPSTSFPYKQYKKVIFHM